MRSLATAGFAFLTTLGLTRESGARKVSSEGKRGKPGPPGPPGAPGSPGVSGWERLTNATTFNKETTKLIDVVCPGTKRLLGGGFQIELKHASDQVVPTMSGALGDSQWRVAARLLSSPPVDDWKLTAYAICADVT
jgi:hypothetical protein